MGVAMAQAIMFMATSVKMWELLFDTTDGHG
jgi:hypothetical protein